MSHDVHVHVTVGCPSPLQLTLADWDSFLSRVVSRNKPRVVLVSTHPRPPLFLRLTSMAYREHLDFGYVCSDTSSSPQQAVLLGRLGVTRGSKALLVFKEYVEPAATVQVHMCTPSCTLWRYIVYMTWPHPCFLWRTFPHQICSDWFYNNLIFSN